MPLEESLNDFGVRTEDVNGPKTTCEVTTLEPEPNLELPFDDDDKYVSPFPPSNPYSHTPHRVVKLIMKVSHNLSLHSYLN